MHAEEELGGKKPCQDGSSEVGKPSHGVSHADCKPRPPSTLRSKSGARLSAARILTKVSISKAPLPDEVKVAQAEGQVAESDSSLISSQQIQQRVSDGCPSSSSSVPESGDIRKSPSTKSWGKGRTGVKMLMTLRNSKVKKNKKQSVLEDVQVLAETETSEAKPSSEHAEDNKQEEPEESEEESEESDKEYWDNKEEELVSGTQSDSSGSVIEELGGEAEDSSDNEEKTAFQHAERLSAQRKRLYGNERQALEIKYGALSRRLMEPQEAFHKQNGRRVITFTITEETYDNISGTASATTDELESGKEASPRRKAVDAGIHQPQEAPAQHEGQQPDIVTSDLPSSNKFVTIPLRYENDPDYPIHFVYTAHDKGQVSKALAHYKAVPLSQQASSYHCLVNLACCYMELSQPRFAKPLLQQAVALLPKRASAHLNLLRCLLCIRDRRGALQAGHHAMLEAEDLTAEELRLLLRSNKVLESSLAQSRRSTRVGPASGQGKQGRKPAAVPPNKKQVAARKQKIIGHHQPVSRLEVWQMRKELLALRSEHAQEVERAKMAGTPSVEEEAKPPWNRHHAYSEDKEESILKQKARWQPLQPEELDLLRFEFAQAAEAAQLGSQNGSTDSKNEDSEEGHELWQGNASDESESEWEAEEGNRKHALHRGPCGEAGKRAYEAIKQLPAMQMLSAKKARALLRAAELLDLPAGTRIFNQGDLAHHTYIILRGSVLIEATVFGPDPVPVETMYDGQVFGDAKVWNSGEEGPVRRHGTAVTQEETTVLQISPEICRKAMGAVEQPSEPQTKSNAFTQEKDLEGVQALPEVKQKVQAMLQSPYFAGAAPSSLVLLASNVQEIQLRYGDVFVDTGEALQACFLIAEGYVRLSVSAINMEDTAGMGSLEDVARITGMGRRPSSVAGDSTKDGGGNASENAESAASGNGCRTSSVGVASFSGEASRPSSARLFPKLSSGRRAGGDVGSGACLASAGKRRSGTDELPQFQLGERSMLLPPAPRTASVVTTATAQQRASRMQRRKPGTPRRGTPWEASLRQERTQPYVGVAPHPDVLLGHLFAGEAFGLATLFDQKGECPYPSACRVWVESSEARILVLTQRSLLYLTEPVARSLVEKLQQKEDPVAPALKDVWRWRTRRSNWIVQKRKVLERTVMHDL
eukprot:TRINITY_DN44482_c0_g1_i1.p1 TRINITY_DN44482_c0_g1~~TRINITY_DN44482_c0_g1_i1.p1  ORF type:complete len:1159 (-),score=266.72 TRINITY_DN44482_c0_g1_i1:156-3632(-)